MLLSRVAASLPPETVTLRDVIERMGERSFGGFMLVLAVPTILPVPLGITVLCDLPILLVAAQMMVGRGTLRLPSWLLDRPWPATRVTGLIRGVVPLFARIGPWLRPRWVILTSPEAMPGLGIACFAMATIAILPIPVLGWIPGFGLVLVALGVFALDGVAVLAGLVLGALSVALFIVVVTGFLEVGGVVIGAGVSVVG